MVFPFEFGVAGLDRYMVFPCEFGVDSHPPRYLKASTHSRGEAVGVMKPFTFICYSHDFAFGLVKIKLP